VVGNEGRAWKAGKAIEEGKVDRLGRLMDEAQVMWW